MFEEYFTGYDPSYNLIFQAEWSSWEEHGFVFLFEKDNRYFSIEADQNAMNCHLELSWDQNLCELDESEAIDLMIEWESLEATY